jgi:glucose/arabinose dehydrogenase
MKNILHPLLITGLVSGAAMAQINPAYTREGATFSPNNQFTKQSMNANLPLVGGMDVFPDGRVAMVEWGCPGSLFILSGLDKGSSGIKATRFATGLDNAMGLKIINNKIYVMEKEALTELVDTDGDGVADEYNSINESFPSDNAMLNFSYDLGYLGGAFYAALSSDVHIGGQDWGTGGYPGTTALAGRSTLYKLNMDGTSSAVACGFRNPNGMWTNGEDLFVTDNQGSWLPSSKVINIKQGRFYGHRTNPINACQTANNNVESPPLAWSNYGDGDDATGRSWGNGVVLTQGTYAGQMLVGETVFDHPNKIVRVFTETVGGELQGAVMPFVKGKNDVNGVFRIKEGPAGRIYLGIAGSNGYWGARSGMYPGFDVLVPTGKVGFDVLAVRNKGNNSFEFEFTKPVGASAGTAGNYKVKAWQNIAVEAYGGGNMSNSTNLTASAATISADKLKVTLTVSGLQTGRIVKFNFSGITAEDGTALFTSFALYNLSKFGPGTDYKAATTAAAPAARFEPAWKLVAGKGAYLMRFGGDMSAPKDIFVYDLSGAKRMQLSGVSGSEVRLETAGLAKGMYMIRVVGAHKTLGTGTLLVP